MIIHPQGKSCSDIGQVLGLNDPPARASCLLETANAERALEAYDREHNRPAFPSLPGVDASAVFAFLDDSAPKTFERRLGPAEEAVVAASEAGAYTRPPLSST